MKAYHKKFNKRAADISARKIIFYIIFGFLVAIVFLFIAFLVPTKSSEISQIPAGMENYVLTQRFLNSCFAMHDENADRFYPIIDLVKFNQENLDKCYNINGANVKAYRLTLKYGTEPKILTTKNWEGFLTQRETNYIFINENGKISRAAILVETQDVK